MVFVSQYLHGLIHVKWLFGISEPSTVGGDFNDFMFTPTWENTIEFRTFRLFG